MTVPSPVPTYRALGYGGAGKLYEGPSLDEAIAAAARWATEQDAGANVRDLSTGEEVFAQIGDGR